MPAFNFSMVNLGKLLDQTKLNVQWWEKYSVSVHQRDIDDTPFFARRLFLLYKPVILSVMLSSVPSILHAQKTQSIGEARLSQQNVHHLQVNYKKQLMLILTNIFTAFSVVK